MNDGVVSENGELKEAEAFGLTLKDRPPAVASQHGLRGRARATHTTLNDTIILAEGSCDALGRENEIAERENEEEFFPSAAAAACGYRVVPIFPA